MQGEDGAGKGEDTAVGGRAEMEQTRARPPGGGRLPRRAHCCCCLAVSGLAPAAPPRTSDRAGAIKGQLVIQLWTGSTPLSPCLALLLCIELLGCCRSPCRSPSRSRRCSCARWPSPLPYGDCSRPWPAAHADPSQNAIKRNAHEHDRFRKVCVQFAQRLHRIDMRMQLGLLQDPAAIDRQVARELAEAEARRIKAQTPTVKTEAQTKAEETKSASAKEAIKKHVGASQKRPRIRPLSETKAIESGANFVSETFIFAVGIGVILVEQWRQRRKQSTRRSGMEDQLESVRSELETVKAELATLKVHQTPEPSESQQKLDPTMPSPVPSDTKGATATEKPTDRK